MACSGCSASFTLFKKEHGCKLCGFSFCSGCLSKKAIVPKLGDNVKHRVCGKCYSILTGSAKQAPSSEQMSPPKALLRRLEESSSKQKMQAGLPKSSKQSGNMKLSSQEKDRRLAEKLEKLKASRMPAHIPTVQDMEERLARLKGLDPDMFVSKKPTMAMYKSSSASTDQVGELLRQAREEAYLDSRQLRSQRSLPDNVPQRDMPLTNDLNKTESSGDVNTFRRASSDSNEGYNPDDPEIARVREMCEQAARRSQEEARGHVTDLEGMDARMSDLNEVNRLLAQVCKDSTAEAERNLRELHKDKDLQKKLLDISKQNHDWSDRRKSGQTHSLEGEEEMSDEDNEKQMADKVLNQLLDESALDQASGHLDKARKKQNNACKPQNNTPSSPSTKPQNTAARNFSPPDEDSSDDELPWCCICNENATVRCIGCDSDLYCKRCYKECHDTLDIQDHKTTPFTVPSSWKPSQGTAV